MKFVIAPDSFKGSLSAREICDYIGEGITIVMPEAEIVKVPMADGGEGTVDALVESTGGHRVSVEVMDPLMRCIVAEYGILGDGRTAVIEMAAASGITLLEKHEMNPLRTSTYGTGQLILHAMEQGCDSFIIGIGGSATNDGGMGMAAALGYRFTDGEGRELMPVGESLGRVRSIDTGRVNGMIARCKFRAACDVDNLLCGPQGAAWVYGRQKGADECMMAVLDEGLVNFAGVVRRYLGVDMASVPGSGAAGGLGGGIGAFLGGSLERGIEIVMDASGLRQRLKGADLVFTGEGRIDGQTRFGKTPWGVAREASRLGIPVVALCGSVGEGYRQLYDCGFTSILSVAPGPVALEECMARTPELLRNAVEALVRLLIK